jgi:hypothetical protein
VPHPPYSPDLALADFFLFPELKTTMKVCRFETLGAIKEHAISELLAITKSGFQKHSKNGRKVGNGVSPVEGLF